MMSDDYSRSTDAILSPLGQELVNVSATNTQNLLREASTRLFSRRHEASAVLNRLTQLNPTVGAQFELKDDMLSEICFRLISSQRPASGDFSSFIIISYCWHYPEWLLPPKAEPIAPGWKVSQPMVDAVMELRDSPEEGVWLDQLCIHQDDDRDKQVHIGAMDIIYRSARRLLILLEDIQLSGEEEEAGLIYAGFYAEMCRIVREQKLQSDELIKFSESFFPRHENLLPNKNQIVRAIRRFTEKLLGARWFSRAWCAHECRIVPHPKQGNPLFLCYSHDGRVLSFEFRCIHYIAGYLEQQFDDGAAFRGEEPSLLQRRCWQIQHVMPQTISDLSAMEHIANIAASGCFHRRDLLSIALNTMGTPLVYTGHVESLEDVIWIFSLLVLASNDPTPLMMAGTVLKLHDTPTTEKTSAWNAFSREGFRNRRLMLHLPNSITRISVDYVELDILLFPSLPQMVSQEASEAAIRLTEEHDLFALVPTSSVNVQRAVETLKNLEDTYRIEGLVGTQTNYLSKWLSLAIECGLDWTTQFPDFVAQETKVGKWIYGILGESADDRLTAAAHSFFTSFVPELKDQGGKKEKTHIRNLIRFLTCILDPRFTLFAETEPRYQPCGLDDFIVTHSISNKSWVAVPAAIAHLPSWEQRAWIIEPFDPVTDAAEDRSSHLPYMKKTTVNGEESCQIDYPVSTSDWGDCRDKPNSKGTWRLRRRDCIFSSKPLSTYLSTCKDGTAPKLIKKQRVYAAEDYNWPAISATAKRLKAELGRNK